MELPAWVGVLQMAKDWATPPWVLSEGEEPTKLETVLTAKTLWQLRWQAYNEELGRAMRDKAAEKK